MSPVMIMDWRKSEPSCADVAQVTDTGKIWCTSGGRHDSRCFFKCNVENKYLNSLIIVCEDGKWVSWEDRISKVVKEMRDDGAAYRRAQVTSGHNCDT